MIDHVYGPRHPAAAKDAWIDFKRWATRTRLPLIAAVSALVLAGLVFSSPSVESHAADLAYLLIALYGLHILSVETAQPSLGHAGFIAVGAYGTAFLRGHLGWTGLVAALAGAALSGALGWLIGYGTSRMRVAFATLATWAFGWIVALAITAFPQASGGVGGINFGGALTIDIPLLGIRSSMGETGHLLLAAALLALVVLGIASARQSSIGLAWAALRDGPSLARSLGYNVDSLRTWAFCAAAALAGLAGSLSAQLLGVVDPTRFAPTVSITLFAAVLIGSRLGLAGPLVGLAVITGVPAVLSSVASSAGFSLDRVQGLITAFLIAVGLLVGIRGDVVAWLGRWRRSSPPEESEPVQGGGAPNRRRRSQRGRAPALKATRIRRAFGGVQAVDGVDLEVSAGEVHGLIGPNGSGKSTLSRCLTGTIAVDDGSVWLGDHELTHLAESERARAGIVRIFQRTVVLEHLTAASQVEAALIPTSADTHPAQAIFKTPAYRAAARDRHAKTLETLRLFGLEDDAHTKAAELSGGHQRLLQIAAVAATRPRVLILDEPAAGMGLQELRLLEHGIHDLAAAGTAVLVVEHNLAFLRKITDRITVLDEGRVIATGRPDQVTRSGAVRRAYLGGT